MKLLPNGCQPTRYGGIGYDVFASENTAIPSGSFGKVKTGLILSLPDHICALLRDRSSMAFNQKLGLFGGVIDPNFHSEIIIGLFNYGEETVYIRKSSRIAQILFLKVGQAQFVKVQQLPAGTKHGFGSSGGI